MARSFHFKLEKILDYRRQAEDQAKLALSQARAAVRDQVRLLDRVEKELSACVAEMSAPRQMSQADLWLWSGWRSSLELDKNLAQAKLTQLELQAEARHKDLVTKSMQRKLLEKLKAKQAEKHEHEEQRAEQNACDEAATLRHGRTSF
ncbi:MAG: flagellar export protein FliJ [Desulfovibrionales bacterium]|nr:flagellar export protein FliJ [Desulfovibrionales bacterium]